MTGKEELPSVVLRKELRNQSINQSINQKKFVLETTTMNIVGLAIVATRYDI